MRMGVKGGRSAAAGCSYDNQLCGEASARASAYQFQSAQDFAIRRFTLRYLPSPQPPIQPFTATSSKFETIFNAALSKYIEPAWKYRNHPWQRHQ